MTLTLIYVANRNSSSNMLAGYLMIYDIVLEYCNALVGLCFRNMLTDNGC